MDKTRIMDESIDLRRLYHRLVKRIWIIVAATVLGAAAGYLFYFCYEHIVQGEATYRIANDYYIYLDYDNYPNGPDYYNAYTWDGILRDDPVVNYALTLIPDVEKQQILDTVTGEILGDYRILTVNVTGTDRDLVQKISDAYKEALPHFASVTDMISHIDVWTDSELEIFDAYTREWNAAFLGGLIAFFISVFAVIIAIIVDDRIYIESDWKKRYPDIVWLGKADTAEYKVNASYILGTESSYAELSADSFEYSSELFDKLRETKGVVLVIRAGITSGEAIDRIVSTLNKQDIKIAGCRTE